jgi:genome maintenance exonuclease 1
VEPKYVHVEPKRFWVGEDRWYEVGGQQYPGVTTVLSKTKQDGYALRRWKANATPEQLAEAEIKKVAGGVRGTLLHTYVEEYLLDGVDGDGPYWESVYPLLKTVDKVHLIESAVCHPTAQVAGTADFFGQVCGVNEVLDWKTSDKEKRADWVEDYFQQLAAYTACLRHMYGKVVDRGRVVIAIPNQEAQQFVLERSDLVKYWKKFRRRRDMYRLLTGK